MSCSYGLLVILGLLAAVSTMPGGWKPEDNTDGSFLSLLDDVYLSSDQSIGEDKLELTGVYTQIVSGINYKYTFKVIGAKESSCSVVIYHQPWTSTKEIIQDTCQQIQI